MSCEVASGLRGTRNDGSYSREKEKSDRKGR